MLKFFQGKNAIISGLGVALGLSLIAYGDFLKEANIETEIDLIGKLIAGVSAGIGLYSIVVKVNNLTPYIERAEANNELVDQNLQEMQRNMIQVANFVNVVKYARDSNTFVSTLAKTFLHFVDLSDNGPFEQTKKGLRKSTFKVPDHNFSFIKKYIENLVENLPDGTIWLGVTEVTNVDEYGENGTMASWNTSLRVRSKNKTLTVYRIFVFKDQTQFDQMKNIMQLDVESNIHVSYSINDKSLSDYSLICIPKAGEQFFHLDSVESESCKNHLFLEFDLAKNSSLSEFNASSETDLNTKLHKFETVWNRTRLFGPSSFAALSQLYKRGHSVILDEETEMFNKYYQGSWSELIALMNKRVKQEKSEQIHRGDTDENSNISVFRFIKDDPDYGPTIVSNYHEELIDILKKMKLDLLVKRVVGLKEPFLRRAQYHVLSKDGYVGYHVDSEYKSEYESTLVLHFKNVYHGGTLKFSKGQNFNTNSNAIILFPSNNGHEITKLLSGERFSLALFYSNGEEDYRTNLEN